MNDTENICTTCNKPQKGKGLTMSQWIMEQDLCICHIKDSAQEATLVQLCEKCKKPLPHFVGGSLTQWIFHPERCSCALGPTLNTKSKQTPTEDELENSESAFRLYGDEIPNEKLTHELGLDSERFLILAEIAHHKNSKIYRCLDKSLNRRVAIKLLAGSSWNAEQIIRFQKEAQITCELSHPHIIQVLDFRISKDEFPYLVTEYLDGITLGEKIEATGAFTEKDCLKIMLQVAKAMDYVHSKNVLHGDLTPANIFLKNENISEVVILDFGIALHINPDQSNTHSYQGKTFVGTPGYASPEQITGKIPDVKSDIYSLGCVFFKLITGKEPFQSDNLLELLRQHKEDTAPKLSDSSNQSISEQVEQLVSKCLNKDPNLRMQSMKEFVSDVESAQESAGADIEQEEKISNLVLETKSKVLSKLLLVTILAGIAVLVICFSMSSYFKSKENKPKWIHRKTKLEEPSYSRSIYPHETRKSTYIAFEISDNELQVLREEKYNKVMGLNLELSNIKGPGLKHLVGKPLTYISLGSRPVPDRDFRYIGKMKTIDSLEIKNRKDLTGDCFKHLGKLTKLKQLNIEGCSLTKLALENISEINSLKEIVMKNCNLPSRKSLELLIELPLVSLDLRNCKPLDLNSIKMLYHIKTLRNLKITQIDSPESFFNSIQRLNNLNALTLDHIERFKPLKFTKLKKLGIVRSSIKLKDLAALSSLPSLKELEIISSPLPDNFADGLLDLKIETLKLARVPLKRKQGIPLKNISSLKRVELRGVKGSISDFQFMKRYLVPINVQYVVDNDSPD